MMNIETDVPKTRRQPVASGLDEPFYRHEFVAVFDSPHTVGGVAVRPVGGGIGSLSVAEFLWLQAAFGQIYQ